MFLMFGAQYVVSGAYALREDGHVRVDVLYTKLRGITRSSLDILTSVIFFIFILAFTATAWNFFANSMNADDYFWADRVTAMEAVLRPQWAIPCSSPSSSPWPSVGRCCCSPGSRG
ncbi:MAG: TRAP transporter small permease subunit [Arhodomonas sp.]|nr:TRAP transporter small permease subunit [Arhodomonas sp.]